MDLTRFPDLPEGLLNPVFVIGDFDGLHEGHCASIRKAHDRGAAFVAVHYPATVLAGRLNRTADLLRGLRSEGAAAVCLVHPVIGGLAVVSRLRESGAPEESITTCDERKAATVRAAVRAGDIALTKRLMGRPYEITGRITAGDRRGRAIGFPTANMTLGPLVYPRFGVYAVRVEIEGRPGGPVSGAANIGVRPTFGGGDPSLEVHLFNFDEDIYGARVRVHLAAMVRGEKKFDGPEALKAQIARDCREARWLLGPAESGKTGGAAV